MEKASPQMPETAPNWKQIPADRDRDVLFDWKGGVKELTPDELKTGKYVPQNYTSEPYDLNNFPAAPTSIEKTEIKLPK